MRHFYFLVALSVLINSIFVSSSWAKSDHPESKVIRFSAEQIQFVLRDMEGEDVVVCKHNLLSHVPWWEVKCGSRSYTVNTWIEVLENKETKVLKLGFMYDVSEGVKSSGESLVQFKSHFTSLTVRELKSVEKINSSLDVRNGLASLDLVVNF